MRILVSGAGIAGPALARFLSKTTAQVTILEKMDAIRPHGQSVDLEGSARIAVKRMGLDDEIRRRNTTEAGSQFIDPKGKPFAPFPLKEGGSISMTSEYEILRGDLAMVLYNATRDFPNITYAFGTTIERVISNNDHDGVVRVELSNGQVRDYDLLVVAEGQWSKLRKQCFPDDMIKVVDKGMYATYWTIPRKPGDNNFWNIYHGLGARILSTRPDPYGTTRACFTIMPSDKKKKSTTKRDSKEGFTTQKQEWVAAARSDRKTQQDLVKRDFADAGWQASRILGAIDDAPDFYFQAIQQIRMSKWYKGRVVCLGDTAYAPTPLTGKGTSLAVLGAYVLAGELSKVIAAEGAGAGGSSGGIGAGDGSSEESLPSSRNKQQQQAPSSSPRSKITAIATTIPDALEAYDKTFRPFVEDVQDIPFFIPRVAHPEGRLGRWVFQRFIAFVSVVVRIPWIASKPGQQGKEDFKLPSYPTLGEEYI